MRRLVGVLLTIPLLFPFLGSDRLTAQESDCVACHVENSPGIVADWRASRHSQMGVDCATCHRGAHTTAGTADETGMPTPETCAMCHKNRVDEFMAGKHALAWAAMNAMPTIHWQPMGLTEGMKGCGGCHKLGAKSPEEIQALKEGGQGYGVASCDVCHTRHLFSREEARQPQACQTCHMGFDHPQWEMYSASKHGVRYLLKQNGVLPEDAAAPTCQTCHMVEGDHEVRTAWGFLAVRTNGLAPYPGESEEWWANRVTILQALGVLDPDGNPTGRLEAVQVADMARLSAEAFDAERDKMLGVCTGCHSETFAQGELTKGDEIIEAGDEVMAEAIRIVWGLYEDGTLETPDHYSYPIPDILTFHDATTPIEQRLFVMFLKHRMRLFQGTFHANPDYALWYGWSEMQMDLVEIKDMAEELRWRKAAGG